MEEAYVSMAISGVLGIVTLVINNRHNDKIRRLEFENAIIKKEQELCNILHTTAKEELAVVRAELRLRDDRDKAELNATILALETKLRQAGSLPGTGSHTPLQDK